METLADRVVVVTGAGRGLGREHALLAAAEGAAVVVNDNGCEPDGTGADPAPAAAVVAEIEAAGGRALAGTEDVATMAGAEALLVATLEAFGKVDGLVNNAGVLRDRMFVNLGEEDWDAVIHGQLRATFCPANAFARHWRGLSKAGETVSASMVNVPSTSGLIGQVGQSNYGAAKAAIGSLSLILAEELGRYGVRVNGVVPVARTRMTADVPAFANLVAAPSDPEEFDVYHPGNVSPLVAWLLRAECAVEGQVFYSKGGEIRRFLGWHYGATTEKPGRWEVDELDAAMAPLVAE
ncbi:MAG TPA: SDR family NAD(P)-dependent oxidoreductase [Solirubrobacterales bacterium]|jgi:NAD(P)-dependent dehydrogenase (short-subunit alcohol dehydrogenase family)|nr:SDR family NAD(P)-dependent oxidoreductase [Solirubrobacterales bacterium]